VPADDRVMVRASRAAVVNATATATSSRAAAP